MKTIMDDLNNRKPQIDYPCAWQFKLIGWDREAIQNAVAAIVDDSIAYILNDSRASSKGKYISMSLELILESEEMRLTYYQQFADHMAIKFVL